MSSGMSRGRRAALVKIKKLMPEQRSEIAQESLERSVVSSGKCAILDRRMIPRSASVVVYQNVGQTNNVPIIFLSTEGTGTSYIYLPPVTPSPLSLTYHN
jgi:hypothetical protein